MKIPNFLFVFLIVSTSVNALENTRDANAIMHAVDSRYRGDTRIEVSTITLIDRAGKERVRTLKELAKEYDGDDEKAVSFVLSPSDVAGTAFLSYNWKKREKEDETWLYLPQLRKVKRLASSDKSGAFLGSDFTFSDLEGLEVDDFDYSFIKDDSGKKSNTIVIEANPKKDLLERVIEDTGYSKAVYWIDPEKDMILNAKYWVVKGNRIKYHSVSELEKINDIWTAKKIQMITTQGGVKEHASVVNILSIEYNKALEDDFFTTFSLERGIK